MTSLLQPSTSLLKLALPTRLLPSSSIHNVQRGAPFSSSSRRPAEVHPLAFPTQSNPTPLQIFHLPADADWSPKLVKSRYYELCKLYHPDLRKGKERAEGTCSSSSSPSSSGDTSSELKQINLAYEILRNPTKRAIYLRSGMGWASPSHRSSSATPWRSNPGYDFTRGRPMNHASHHRGPFPSSAWDWSDPHNPHFRPGFAGGAGDGAAGQGGGSATGWKSQGQVASNGMVFLAVSAFTLFLMPITLWTVSPSVGTEESEGLMVGDRRHREAVKALDQARREARDGGAQKREAIARRVRQIERARAFEKAREMERIERGQGVTGHLQLPAPAPPSEGAGL